MIPIAFQDASTPRKPRKNAGEGEVAADRETMRQRNLNALAIEKLAALQEERTQPGEDSPPGAKPLTVSEAISEAAAIHGRDGIAGRARKQVEADAAAASAASAESPGGTGAEGPSTFRELAKANNAGGKQYKNRKKNSDKTKIKIRIFESF